MDVKRKTVGVDWKVPIQLLVSLAAWLLLRYTGIDIEPQIETIVALLAGLLAGVLGPAPKTVLEKNGAATVEGGSSHMRSTGGGSPPTV